MATNQNLPETDRKSEGFDDAPNTTRSNLTRIGITLVALAALVWGVCDFMVMKSNAIPMVGAPGSPKDWRNALASRESESKIESVSPPLCARSKKEEKTAYVEMGAFCYKLNDFDAELVSFNDKSATQVVVPGQVDGKPLTLIRDGAFNGCAALKSVTFADDKEWNFLSVAEKKIMNGAFSGCFSLESLTFHEEWSFEEGAFEKHSVKSVVLRMETLMNRFDLDAPPVDCWAYMESLESLTLGGVGEASHMNFSGCKSLKTVTIEEERVVNAKMFAGCPALEAFVVLTNDGYNLTANCSSIDGVLFSAGGRTLLCYPSGRTATEYVVPDGVQEIAENAFSSSTLTSISLPNDFRVFAENTFSNCAALKSIEVAEGNESFRSIDGVLFSADGKTLIYYPGGRTATEYVVPDGVKTIGRQAFRDCVSLKFIATPDSLQAIAADAFNELEAIIYDGGEQKLLLDAFKDCRATTRSEFASENAFFRFVDGVLCSVDGKTLLCYPNSPATEYVVPDGVETIGAVAFCGGGSLLKSISLPNGLKAIAPDAFFDCESLEELTFNGDAQPDCLQALTACRALRRLTLGPGARTAAPGAFTGLSALEAIEVAEGNESFRSVDGVLFSADGKTLLCYPSGKTATEYVVPDGVERIENGAFTGCAALTSVSLPVGLRTFDETAFSGCVALESVEVAEENVFFRSVDGVLVSADGKTLLYYPSGKAATEYVVPDGVERIEDGAFSGCAALTTVAFPDGLRKIGDGAFSGCSALTSVAFPDGLRKIGDGAFSGCSALTTVAFPDGLRKIGNDAFSGCSALTTVAFPKSLRKIGADAFSRCAALERITPPRGCVIYVDPFASGTSLNVETTRLGDASLAPSTDARSALGAEMNALENGSTLAPPNETPSDWANPWEAELKLEPFAPPTEPKFKPDGETPTTGTPQLVL